MKLIDSNITVEDFGIQKEESFSIGDMGMVLDILRSKLYANPIAAICREITCNARDAHREVGKADLPIKIVMPSTFDPNYRVIDFGPGIDPDRMSNIFVKFASSTKRNTNEQTGGFGLGAKTPFAYGDSFTIITTTNGVKRTYVAYIDTSKVGKMSLLHSVATDAPNGTEIVIPVKASDFSLFQENTEKAVQYWDIQPNVVGEFKSLAPSEENLLMSGEDYKIFKQNCGVTINIIIDGIAYPTNSHEFNYNKNTEILYQGSKKLLVYFPNGYLNLSANRETIHWDEETKKKVSDKLEKIAKDIKARISSKIDEAPTYIDAAVLLSSLQKAFYTAYYANNDFFWRGQRLYNCLDKHRSYQTYSVDRNTQIVDEYSSLSKDTSSRWFFSWSDVILINDVGIKNVSSKRIIQILNLLPKNVNTISVVGSNFLNHPDPEVKKIIHNVPYINLSEVPGIQNKKGEVRSSMKLVFSVRSSHTINKQSFEVFSKTNNKVLVLLDRDSYTSSKKVISHSTFDQSVFPNQAKLKEGYSIRQSLNDILSAMSTAGYQFWGIDREQYVKNPKSYKDIVSQCQLFNNAFYDFVSKRDFTEINFANSFISFGDVSRITNNIEAVLSNLTPKLKDLFSKYLENHKKIKDIKLKKNGIENFSLLFENPPNVKCDVLPEHVEAQKLENTIRSVFPMLDLIDYLHKEDNAILVDYLNSMAEFKGLV